MVREVIDPYNDNNTEYNLKDPIMDIDNNLYIIIDAEEHTNQKELIEQDLDSQPDDNQLDEFISNLEYPEVIPSCKTYDEWLNSQYEILEMIRTGYADYIKDYRKELREWWLNKNKDKYVTNDQGEILFVNGIAERKDYKYQNTDTVDDNQQTGINNILQVLNG